MNVVDISGADSDGKAKRIQKSDKVWTNDAVTNFSVDKEYEYEKRFIFNETWTNLI